MGLGELAHSPNEYLVIGEGGPTGGLLTLEKSFISILDNISRVGLSPVKALLDPLVLLLRIRSRVSLFLDVSLRLQLVEVVRYRT
jgi:hypothetical protein